MIFWASNYFMSSYQPSSFPPTEDDVLAFSGRTGASDLPFMMDEDQDSTSEPDFISEVKGFSDLLNTHSCYEMIPASGKIVVLDVALDVKVAFRALIENRIKSAPLWDFNTGEYVGMITVTDFIDIIRYFYHTKDGDPSELIQQDYHIHTWRGSYRK